MNDPASKKSIRRFRIAGIAEGISFLTLLFIAMPLKYIFNIPEAVKITGWVHGILFVLFLWLAFDMMGRFKKGISWFLKAFIAAVVPLGTFVFDRQLKKEEQAL